MTKLISSGGKALLLIGLLFLGAIAGSIFGLDARVQEKSGHPKSESLKLAYSGELVEDDGDTPPALDPVFVSSNRLLVPVGDTLYMLNARNEVVWDYPVEPNIIFDVTVDSKGTIYMAVSDGLLVALNASGKEVWGHSMVGSANYTQLESYRGGVLAVISMEAYRAFKGSDSEDTLVLWKDNKQVWRKEFPRNAELHVFGDRVLAIKGTKEGKEIQEIR